MKNLIFLLGLGLFFTTCKKDNNSDLQKENLNNSSYKEVSIKYATGFSIQTTQTGHYLTITNPWPDAKETYRYKIVKKARAQHIPEPDAPTFIQVPLSRVILTSTTHVPPVVLLDKAATIKGFPGTDYISNTTVRKRIDAGKVTDVGSTEMLSIERIVTMQPQLVMGYGIANENETFTKIMAAGIPVLFNGDWTEEHPLGKAEWIKVFGLLYDKQEEAQRIFNEIETAYLTTKALVANLKPTTVMAGATWKDSWYLPYGNSWQGKLITDAGGDYIYKNTVGKGSLSYNIERVLKDAQPATIWIAPAQYTSYSNMLADQPAYALFNAFKNKQVYTFALTTGAKGGVTYYEEAAMRPDIVLKDLVSILHPEVKLAHTPYFFKPLTN